MADILVDKQAELKKDSALKIELKSKSKLAEIVDKSN